jgi:hypothetical protein
MLTRSEWLGALIAHQVLRPNALVIRPDAVGFSAGKEKRWVSRESFERVKVVFNLFGPDVLLMSASGKTVRSLVVTQLLMKELRQALRKPVIRWRGGPGRRGVERLAQGAIMRRRSKMNSRWSLPSVS